MYFLLVYKYIVYRGIGVLCNGVLVYCCIYWCIGVLVYWRIGVLVQWCIDVLCMGVYCVCMLFALVY